MHNMQKAANLAIVNKKGLVVIREIEITVEEPDNASIMLDKNKGFSIKRAIDEQIGLSFIADPEKVRLIFYHDSRHFAHRRSIYPQSDRMVITYINICSQQEHVPYPRLILN